jgi:hypothetical protein
MEWLWQRGWQQLWQVEWLGGSGWVAVAGWQ